MCECVRACARLYYWKFILKVFGGMTQMPKQPEGSYFTSCNETVPAMLSVRETNIKNKNKVKTNNT